MDIQTALQSRTPKEVINDNALFQDWLETIPASQLFAACPSIVSDLMETFNDEWIEEVESACAENGVELDSDFEIVTLTPDSAYEAGYKDALEDQGNNAYAFAEGELRESYLEGFTDGVEKAGG